MLTRDPRVELKDWSTAGSEAEALLCPGAGLLSVCADRSLSEIASWTSRSRDVHKLDSDGCS